MNVNRIPFMSKKKKPYTYKTTFTKVSPNKDDLFSFPSFFGFTYNGKPTCLIMNIIKNKLQILN